MLLVIENCSTYTEKILEFLSKKNIPFKCLQHTDIQNSILQQYDSFILSGRQKNDQQMNAVNSGIIKHAISENKPLLGICYGAEILVLTLGGTIRKMDSLKKGIQQVQVVKENPLCTKTVQVFESHRFEISKLPSSLVTIATSDESKPEIIHYENSTIYGTQFHPEMTEDGQTIIENFTSF